MINYLCGMMGVIQPRRRNDSEEEFRAVFELVKAKGVSVYAQLPASPLLHLSCTCSHRVLAKASSGSTLLTQSVVTSPSSQPTTAPALFF